MSDMGYNIPTAVTLTETQVKAVQDLIKAAELVVVLKLAYDDKGKQKQLDEALDAVAMTFATDALFGWPVNPKKQKAMARIQKHQKAQKDSNYRGAP